MGKRRVAITGADRGLGLALCECFLQGGWQVYAGRYMPEWTELDRLEAQYRNALCCLPLDVGSEQSITDFARAIAAKTDKLDMLVSNAGVPSRIDSVNDPVNAEDIRRVYGINAVGGMLLTKALLPLFTADSLRRLCYVSSEAGSIAMNWRNSMYTYCMSKTALNMGVRLLYNELYPQGYTFRLYHPGWLRSYMGGTKSTQGDMEPEESAVAAFAQFTQARADESRLVLMDYQGTEIPF